MEIDKLKIQTQSRAWWLPLIFILALLPRVTDLNVFLAHDETLFWDWSRQFFFSLLHGDLAGTIVGPGNPNIMPMWAQTAVLGLEYGWAWLNGRQAEALAAWPAFQPHLLFSELAVRRLPVVLLNTLAVTAIWWFCQRLFGRRLALIAALLLIFDPFVLADSRTGRGEGMLSGFVTVALLTFIYFWHSGRRRYLLISGVVTGLAWLTKLSALSLVPTAALITLVYLWPRPNWPVWAGGRRAAIVLGVWVALALATFWALWPAMWVAPLAALRFLWSFVHNVGLEGRTNYFFGQLYQAEFLPFYYPVVFILRVTPLTLAGLAAFAGFMAARAWAGRAARPGADRVAPEPPPPFPVAPLLLVAAFPIIFGLFMTAGVLKRDWYLMPAFPSLDIVAAGGLVWLGEHLQRRFWPHLPARLAGSLGLALVLLGQAGLSLTSHPFYYTYWNPLVLGGRWAAQAVMVGWDLDLGVGAHYLNGKPNAGRLKVATRTTRGFQEIFQGETIPLAIDSDWVQADYLLVRQTHLQLGKHDPWELNYLPHLKLEHVVNLGGVDYLWIYQAPRAQYSAGPSQLVGKGTLFGYNLSAHTIEPGQTLHFRLYWLQQGATEQDAFFVRLTDLAGYIWAQTSAQPAPGFKLEPQARETMLESLAGLPIPVGAPPGRYFVQMGFYNQAREEEIGLFTLPEAGRAIEVKPASRPLDPPQMAHALHQPINSSLSLLGFDLPTGALSQRDRNELILYWQAQAPVEQDLAIGLQLLAPAGHEAAYWLGRPVKSGYPTNQWRPGEIVKDPWDLALPAGIAPGDYTLRLTLYGPDNQAVGTTDLGPVSVVDRRRLLSLPAVQHQLEAYLGQAIALRGYNLFEDPLTGGGRFTVQLYWQARQPIPGDYTVFTQVIGPAGTVVGQHDGVPAAGTLPTSTWQVGEIVPDRHQIDFATAQPGEYRLIVGLYDPDTGARLPVSGAARAPSGDFLTLKTFKIE